MGKGIIERIDEKMESFAERLIIRMEKVGAGPLKRFMLDQNWKGMGKCVLTGLQITENISNNATAICRRCFEAVEIVVMVVLDEAEEGKAGTVFTEKGIYHWREGEEAVAEILYNDIGAIGYQGDSVILTYMEKDESFAIFCGEEAEEKHYSRYMYNYIVDICKFLEKALGSEKKETGKQEKAE